VDDQGAGPVQHARAEAVHRRCHPPVRPHTLLPVSPSSAIWDQYAHICNANRKLRCAGCWLASTFEVSSKGHVDAIQKHQTALQMVVAAHMRCSSTCMVCRCGVLPNIKWFTWPQASPAPFYATLQVRMSLPSLLSCRGCQRPHKTIRHMARLLPPLTACGLQ
jgi:hypothetical protein